MAGNCPSQARARGSKWKTEITGNYSSQVRLQGLRRKTETTGNSFQAKT